MAEITRHPSLLLSPGLQFTSRFPLSPLLQVAVSLFPRAPCAFPPTLQDLRVFVSQFLLIHARLHLRPCPRPCAHVLYEFPVSAPPHPASLCLYPLPLPRVVATRHTLSLRPSLLRLPGSQSPSLRSYSPTFLLKSLGFYKPPYLYPRSLQASISTFLRKARRVGAKSQSFILPQAGCFHRHTGNPLMASVLCMIMSASRKQKPDRRGVQSRGRKVGRRVDEPSCLGTRDGGFAASG